MRQLFLLTATLALCHPALAREPVHKPYIYPAPDLAKPAIPMNSQPATWQTTPVATYHDPRPAGPAVTIPPLPTMPAEDTASNSQIPPTDSSQVRLQEEPRLPKWTTIQDAPLSHTIRSWASQAGYTFNADTDDRWRVTVRDSYSGDFLGALEWLLSGFRQSPRPAVEITPNFGVILIRAE